MFTSGRDGSSTQVHDEVEELLKYNEAPSYTAAQVVQKILTQPLTEIESLDTEIKYLEQRLVELKSKRTRAQEMATRYSSIISPIRRMPSDILHEIFYHCLSTHRNPIMSATEAPVLLTRICSKWRATAHASPRLWSRICIPFSDDLLPNTRQAFPPLGPSKLHVIEALLLRCQVVDEWLSRSGACPLSISVHYSSQRLLGRLQPPGASDITSRLFSILARFSHRWHNLDLAMPNDVCHKLGSLVTPSDLAILNTYTAIFPYQNITDSNQSLTLLKAKNIRKFRISVGNYFWKITDFSLNWSQLTHFVCNLGLSIPETSNFLNNCTNLVHFTVHLERDYEGRSNPSSPLIYQDTIYLQSLRSANITDSVQPNLLGNIYDSIDAPQLHQIGYTMIDNDSHHDPGDYPFSICGLLQKSTMLKKLRLQATERRAPFIRHLLHSANSITHLVLGQETRTNEGSLRRQRPLLFGMPVLQNNCRWSFEDVFAAQEYTEGTYPKATRSPSTPSLLPNLEILEVSDESSPYVSNHALCDFILSRMDPSSNRAVLKQVSVLFNNPKEKDIEEDVYRQAQLIGLKIKLELDYFQDYEPWNCQRTYPEYGLNEYDEYDDLSRWGAWD